jgi:hypothetical protein
VTVNAPPFPTGAAVRLRGRAFGEPGAVLRIERCKVVVYWPDLDFLLRHRPESLMPATEDGPRGATK